MILPGSERRAVAHARPAGPVDLDQLASVTVVLRRRGPVPTGVVDRAVLALAAGAEPADLLLVEQVLTGEGLQVTVANPAMRTVRVTGRLELLQEVFGTQLEHVQGPDGTHRQRTGPLWLPAALSGVVVAVLGLDDRPQARPDSARRPPRRRRSPLSSSAKRTPSRRAPTAAARSWPSSNSAAATTRPTCRPTSAGWGSPYRP